MSLKPRTYNPAFTVTIELVTKALFYLLDKEASVDHTFKIMKGQYHSKEKNIVFNQQDLVLV